MPRKTKNKNKNRNRNRKLKKSKKQFSKKRRTRKIVGGMWEGRMQTMSRFLKKWTPRRRDVTVAVDRDSVGTTIVGRGTKDQIKEKMAKIKTKLTELENSFYYQLTNFDVAESEFFFQPNPPGTKPFRRSKNKFDNADKILYKIESEYDALSEQYKILEKASENNFVFNCSKDDECLICLQELQTDFQKLSCGHCFHKGCLNTSMGINRLCPTCRMPIEYIQSL